MSSFCDTFDLTSLIKEPACYKNPDNPSCIDLILTNKPLSFQNSCVAETGLSDFHRMILTVTKMTFQKLKPRVISCRDYKHFNNETYRNELLSEISNSCLNFDDSGFNDFFDICRAILDEHAPRKQKYAISKEIMKRTQLRNKFLKERNDENKRKYASQRNYCVSLLRKTKKDYCEKLYNTSVVENSIFPSVLKLADITRVFKKGDKECKDNHRPVSILSNVSKVFERIIFRQISNYMKPFLTKYQCGFRQGYSTQHCLLSMLEKWKRAVDNGKVFGILLTDLSKTFDCLSHELLLAKLHAYGFSLSALRLIHSYLTNRKQRTKINSSYSSWEEILFGVPQGSILGPLLFNIFLFDMFFVVS